MAARRTPLPALLPLPLSPGGWGTFRPASLAASRVALGSRSLQAPAQGRAVQRAAGGDGHGKPDFTETEALLGLVGPCVRVSVRVCVHVPTHQCP